MSYIICRVTPTSLCLSVWNDYHERAVCSEDNFHAHIVGLYTCQFCDIFLSTRCIRRFLVLFALLHFIGCQLTLVSDRSLHLFPMTICLTNSPPYVSDLTPLQSASLIFGQLRRPSSICPYSSIWSKVFCILRPFCLELYS